MAKITNSDTFSRTLTSILVSKNRDEIIELSKIEDALSQFIVCRMLSYRTELANEDYYNMLGSMSISGLSQKTTNLLLAKCLPKLRSGFCKKW